MNSASESVDRSAAQRVEQAPVRANSWALWTRQTLAILRLEISKNFLSRRAFLLYLIAVAPLLLLSMLALVPPPTDEMENFSQLSQVFAGIYGALILRTLVFFGCAWVFMNLFRGEVVDRSLHYYFLAPPGLKKISVIHYLQSLVPVPMSEGPFAVLVEPTPAWIAVPSLLLFTGVVLFLACLHIRRMEISYAGD